MAAIINTVLLKDESIWLITSTYTDIFINKDMVLVVHIKKYLVDYGPTGKDPELLENVTIVLGLEVWKVHNTLHWKHESKEFTFSVLFDEKISKKGPGLF